MTIAEGSAFLTQDSLKELNNYLTERSYIEGYQPSQADWAVFDAVDPEESHWGSSPSKEHLQRWYKHLKSFSLTEKNAFPGEKKLPSFLTSGTPASETSKSKSIPKKDEGDDDDIDLFGSDEEEDAEAERIREERLKAYSEKKSKKPALIAKSSIVLDVKPWDDETDMKAMEEQVRTIVKDGLVWGASKLVPVGYGIKKLQIMCVVEDEKISVDDLTEEITGFEDYVQSVDIAAFNKI